MRLPRGLLLAAVVLVPLLGGPPGNGILRAQDESGNNTTSSTTYDSTGKVTAISEPVTITVNSRRGPFTYQLGPDVFVFKADNKPGRVGDVHVGQTVTVYYYKRLGQETVARLVILKPESAAKSKKREI